MFFLFKFLLYFGFTILIVIGLTTDGATDHVHCRPRTFRLFILIHSPGFTMQ